MAFRNKSVSVHSQALIPRHDIPRSSFRMQHSHKTTFNATRLVPIYVDEMVPGDRFNMRLTAFARLATPLVPVMDNLHLETFFFFVPCRLIWNNWVKLQGEQENPDDSTDYLVPILDLSPPNQSFPSLSIFDYFGLPCEPQCADLGALEINALPFRAYNLIFNEWFRDQNLVDAMPVPKDDGPDSLTGYQLLQRAKRPDYFTLALPWTQKGAPVTLPLGTTAPVYGKGAAGYPQAISVMDGQPGGTTARNLQIVNASAGVNLSAAATSSGSLTFSALEQPLYVNLEAATSASINLFRLALQMQVALERDARGGTRYVESIKARFGVTAPDFRLQRPEYIGGGHTMVSISAVPQTSATSADGTDTPQGTLAATGSALASGHGFTYSATEHGYVIGLMNVRADINYQQGLRKLWSRRTRWDFFEPVFSGLGEQAILNKEIFVSGTAVDEDVFGYQERFGEYRYFPSLITGLFNSTNPLTIDYWHYAEEFVDTPDLNATFIVDKTENTLERAIAVHEEAGGQQLIADLFFDCQAARPMPMYGVPSLGTRF